MGYIGGACKRLGIVAMLLALLTIPARAGHNPNHNPGGDDAVITAVFSPDHLSVTVTSTKDLSNVVLAFCDGIHQKFDGLSGKSGTFSGTGTNQGKPIATVWVKSGNNDSGDGPGYGQRFNNPNNPCAQNGVGGGNPPVVPPGTPTTPAPQGAAQPGGAPLPQTGSADLAWAALGGLIVYRLTRRWLRFKSWLAG